MDRLANIQIFDTIKEFILPVMTFLLGLLWERIKKWFKTAKQRARFAYTKKIKPPSNAAWIIDSAVPEFLIDKSSITDTKNVFILSITDEAKALLSRKTEKHEEAEFYYGDDKLLGFQNWLEIEKLTGIKNLEERVNRHRKSVSMNALVTKKKFYFNSQKIGVRKIDLRRVNDEETSYLSIAAYHTDYFTHRVMQNVIREWTEEDRSVLPAIQKDISLLFEKYYLFCTSLGLNAFILTEWRDELILARRSKRVDDSNHDDVNIHVTMNEGFSSIDFDYHKMGQGNITIDNCFRRGMEEELGIAVNSRALSPIHIYDIFFVPDLFQIGLFGWAIYEGDWFDLKYERAQDRALEVEEVFKVKFDSKNIEKLLNSGEVIPYTTVGIEQLSRLFGVITPDWKFLGYEYYFLFTKYLFKGLFPKTR